jgi:hypothetical protein
MTLPLKLISPLLYDPIMTKSSLRMAVQPPFAMMQALVSHLFES